MDLADKTLVITGAGGGLGASMARRLAACGARLALVDLQRASLQKLADDCMNAGSPAARACVFDVTDEAAVDTGFAGIASDFGGLHGLVNNAGITRDALLVKVRDGEVVSRMSLADWRRVIDVNMTGVFLCGRAAATHMASAGEGGCIINISSISRTGNFGQTNYSASKAGAEAMSGVWAKELAAYGIRAAAIAPGFIKTEMVDNMKPAARDKLTAGIPVHRVGDPDEIARTVQFIFQNDYINGRCFDIDGGLRI